MLQLKYEACNICHLNLNISKYRKLNIFNRNVVRKILLSYGIHNEHQVSVQKAKGGTGKIQASRQV